MHPHDAPDLLRRARPDTPPDRAALDLDRIVRDGYRARRRSLAVLGAATSAGVASVAAVLALAVSGPPPADADPMRDGAVAGGAGDSAMSGYPFEPDEEFGTAAERSRIGEAAAAAFGDLIAESGLLGGSEPELDFGAVQTPGNYGQTWLRSFAVQLQSEGGDEEVVLRIESLLPGGWTPEPGPATDQVFPQHLISAAGAPWYEDADWTDELTTTELDDGRVMHVVDHECAFEAAVAYPNGTGLRASWDMGCGRPAPEHPVALEDFTAAVEAMPEFDFDTTGLAPVGDLVDVPVGWTYDPDWDAGAQAGVDATADAARAALEAARPGAYLGEGVPVQIGDSIYGAAVTRTYVASGEYPAEHGDVGFDLRYLLPGGWLPGIADPPGSGPYPVACQNGFTCTQTTDDDGTTWAVAESEEDPGEMEVVRFDPDGWAVGLRAASEIALDAGALADLLRAMPAPVYDTGEVPTVPAE
jgi:hypothetical protein